MKYILPIIIILIILIFTILILNHKYYFSEDFIGSYDQNTIEDLIPLTYVPSNPYLKEEITEYEIIDIYKKILNRPPTLDEIKLKTYQPKDELIEELYNSYEYEKMTKVQDNMAEGGIESSIAKRNLLRKIIDMYKKKYNKEPEEKILMPLRDCFIHLRSNHFLFKAFLETDNYLKFENEVLTSITMTKKLLLEIFNKHYNLLELKLKAEEEIKNTKGGIEDNTETVDVETLKKELNKLTSNAQPPSQIPNQSPPNVANVNEVNNYLNQQISSNSPLKERFDDKELTPELKAYIDELLKNSKNGDLKEPFNEMFPDISSSIKNYINNALTSNQSTPVKEETVKEPEKPNEIRRITSELPENSEVYVRVYNPIEYKQRSYTGDPRFRPPICTSLGQKPLEQPIFTESKLLFQGAEIDKAFEETQVGSIMPKFVYKEYQDVRVK